MTSEPMTLDPAKIRELVSACARLPWKIEHDWTLELQDADGNLLGKFMAGAAPGKPVVPLLLYLVNHAEEIAAAVESVATLTDGEKCVLDWIDRAVKAERRVAELEAELDAATTRGRELIDAAESEAVAAERARDEAVRRVEAAEAAIRAYLSAHEGPFPSAEVKARQGMRDVLATLEPKGGK